MLCKYGVTFRGSAGQMLSSRGVAGADAVDASATTSGLSLEL